jgi:hypothetical protein
MNRKMASRTQRKKMGRMKSHIERSTEIKNPWTRSWRRSGRWF